MAANTLTTLDGLQKRVYADRDPARPIPDIAKLQAMWPFKAKGRVGDRYELPVVVALEQGVTYGNPASSGAFTLNAAKPGQVKPSYVTPYEMVLRSAIAYSAAMQAIRKGPAAFKSSTSLLYESMNETLRRRLEIALIGYGRSGLGTVESMSGAVATITAATWAPGLWYGLTGAELIAFDGATGTDTQHDGAGSDDQYVIQSVDLVNRQVTLDAAGALATGDVLYFRSQRTATAWVDMLGLEQIATTSGTLFGIDNSTYDVFKGFSYDVGSTDLSVDALEQVAAELAVRGSSGPKRCMISPKTYANLTSDLAALVAYDQKPGMKSYVIGAENITVHTPSGKLTIEGHEMIKEGEGYVFEPKRFMRSGATDITFNRNFEAVDADVNGAFFTELADSAGFEVRAYSNQFLFSTRPSACCKLTNIVNS